MRLEGQKLMEKQTQFNTEFERLGFAGFADSTTSSKGRGFSLHKKRKIDKLPLPSDH